MLRIYLYAPPRHLILQKPRPKMDRTMFRQLRNPNEEYRTRYNMIKVIETPLIPQKQQPKQLNDSQDKWYRC